MERGVDACCGTDSAYLFEVPRLRSRKKKTGKGQVIFHTETHVLTNRGILFFFSSEQVR